MILKSQVLGRVEIFDSFVLSNLLSLLWLLSLDEGLLYTYDLPIFTIVQVYERKVWQEDPHHRLGPWGIEVILRQWFEVDLYTVY